MEWQPDAVGTAARAGTLSENACRSGAPQVQEGPQPSPDVELEGLSFILSIVSQCALALLLATRDRRQ